MLCISVNLLTFCLLTWSVVTEYLEQIMFCSQQNSGQTAYNAIALDCVKHNSFTLCRMHCFTVCHHHHHHHHASCRSVTVLTAAWMTLLHSLLFLAFSTASAALHYVTYSIMTSHIQGLLLHEPYTLPIVTSVWREGWCIQWPKYHNFYCITWYKKFFSSQSFVMILLLETFVFMEFWVVEESGTSQRLLLWQKVILSMF